MMTAPLFCQTPDGSGRPCEQDGPGRPDKPGRPENKAAFDRIRAEKIAFFTSELDLSPEEAEKFWPVYNQFSKESKEAHDATMKALQGVCTAKEKNLQKKEIESAVDAYVKAFETENKVLGKYYPQFKKVLPIEKVARLFKAEEDFKIKMIRGLRAPR